MRSILLVVAAISTSAPALERGAAQPIGDSPTRLSGRATDIHDGDTFRFGGTRIRLFGIDAPELDDPGGRAAREALALAIAGGRVSCTDTGARSYDRIVARCVNAKGYDLARIMVRSGWAVDWWYHSCGLYLADEADAQKARRGIFGGRGVVPVHERPRDRKCGA